MSAVITAAPRAARGGRYTMAYLAVFLLFWTLVPLLLQQEPPIDNVEQLNWALHPALGYSKHPPLPTLVLWLFEQVAPAGILLTYVLGAAQVACLLALAFALGRDTLGARRAFVGALLITCISYHTLRLHFYNHNTALLCATAAAALCTWRAVRSQGLGWWVALGIAWACGMLSKYQMVLGIACNAGFALWALRAQPATLVRGLLAAGAVASVGVAPHLLWLVQHHFPTLDYASGVLGTSLSAYGRADSVLRFLASQGTRLAAPAVALFALHRLSAGSQGAPPKEAHADDARMFWRIHAFGPLLLMAAMALLGGVDLEMHWGTAYLWALPPWYLSTIGGARLATLRPLTALAVVAVVQSILMTGKLLFPDL
jgi:hypothetical protein